MAGKIRWGILGTGHIARKFAAALSVVQDAALVAVGSRSQESADAFGDEFGVPRRHAGYEALAADEEVDVVYVASPHPMHEEHSVLCMDAGKAVLCEKPLAANFGQAQRIVEAARRNRVFLMEAMWTRFLPAVVRVRRWLSEGAIGRPRMMRACFGFRADFNPEGRLFNPHLAGGGLLDVGIYPLAFSFMVFGRPKRVFSAAHVGDTGVDEHAAMLLEFDGGALASLACAVRTQLTQDAVISGEEGEIVVGPLFWRAEKAALHRSDGGREVFEKPFEVNGLNYQADAVCECLRQGSLECDVMPHDESLALARAMDEMRAQWGVRYPFE